MPMNKSTFLALVLLASPQALKAQTTPPDQAPVSNPSDGSVDVGLPYIPLYGGSVGFGSLFSSRSRGTFGRSGISLAPGLGPAFTKYGLSLAPGFNFFHASSLVDGERNQIFLVSLGPNFRYGLVKPITAKLVDGKPVYHFRTFAPFLEAGVSLVYGDLSVHSEGISNKTLTVGGNFAIGTSITKNAFVRATLRILPLIDSYDFNRYGFELGVRF